LLIGGAFGSGKLGKKNIGYFDEKPI